MIVDCGFKIEDMEDLLKSLAEKTKRGLDTRATIIEICKQVDLLKACLVKEKEANEIVTASEHGYITLKHYDTNPIFVGDQATCEKKTKDLYAAHGKASREVNRNLNRNRNRNQKTNFYQNKRRFGQNQNQQQFQQFQQPPPPQPNQNWKCFNCEKMGHIARECTAPKKN